VIFQVSDIYRFVGCHHRGHEDSCQKSTIQIKSDHIPHLVAWTISLIGVSSCFNPHTDMEMKHKVSG